MKTLQTQFDDKRLSNAVATPTCSSCCCCCCCLATSIASSTLLVQRVAKEGEKHQVPNRHLLSALASLFMPIVGILVYVGFWTINTLLRTCTEHSYRFTPSSTGQQSYTTACTNPGSASIIPLLIIVPFLVLLYLYSRVRIEKPLKRAILVTILIAVAFTAEFFGGAILILTGVGGIFYLVMVPIIVGWITAWYHLHIGKEVSKNGPVAAGQAAYPVPVPTKEHHDEDQTTREEPPQQNPPVASTQQ